MSSRSVVYVVGARPNFMKTAPVLQAMRRRAPTVRHVLVHTGQHYDDEMSRIFFEELGLGEPDRYLGVGPGPHGGQTARALEALEQVFVTEQPDLVVVAGDVNSTLAGALAAAKLEIPVAHIESGLRSFDRTMPEELNRLLTDQIATWCFTHSPEAEENLRREGVDGERIFFVGNTMIDTLVRMRAHVERSNVHARFGLEPHGYVLVTLHRPALVDGPLFERTFERLVELGRELDVVFPVHPRSRGRLEVEVPGRVDGLRLVDPVGYIDFLALETQARAVLTDSGGVQEETTYLRVPCFTLRANTERPVTVTNGTNTILGLDPDAIASLPGLLEQVRLPLDVPVGWDGRAAERIATVLSEALGVAGLQAPAASG